MRLLNSPKIPEDYFSILEESLQVRDWERLQKEWKGQETSVLKRQKVHPWIIYFINVSQPRWQKHGKKHFKEFELNCIFKLGNFKVGKFQLPESILKSSSLKNTKIDLILISGDFVLHFSDSVFIPRLALEAHHFCFTFLLQSASYCTTRGAANDAFKH